MNYEQAMEYIHAVQWAGHKPGLTRTRTLLAALGDPHKQLRFIHVAGTNGKGSTAAMLASCLQAAGYRVGLYTSPFINRFNERIQVNGQQIPDEELVRLVERVKPAADAMADVPTEFEIITALGMLYFAERHCDIVVLEVGLGGTLDSTNVIDPPECAVITPERPLPRRKVRLSRQYYGRQGCGRDAGPAGPAGKAVCNGSGPHSPRDARGDAGRAYPCPGLQSRGGSQH